VSGKEQEAYDRRERVATEPWRLLKQVRKRGYLTSDGFDQMFGPELPPDCKEALMSELRRLNQHHGYGR
jgi:hypothetical protein